MHFKCKPPEAPSWLLSAPGWGRGRGPGKKGQETAVRVWPGPAATRPVTSQHSPKPTPPVYREQVASWSRGSRQ